MAKEKSFIKEGAEKPKRKYTKRRKYTRRKGVEVAGNVDSFPMTIHVPAAWLATQLANRFADATRSAAK